MVILLNTENINKKMTGASEVSASAGQVFKIETTPGGEEVLNETVPAGKAWSIHVSVHIEESDA